MKAFPHITVSDLKKYENEKKEISVANIQIETPYDFSSKTTPPKLTHEAENEQKQKIHKYLKEAMERGSNLIVLPELSTSENICKEIKKKFSNSQAVIVMGSYYNDRKENCSLILIDGESYGQIKNNPSYDERTYMRRTNDVNVFINTPIGDFAVLICYDATDFSMLATLQDYTDFLVCVARTRDVATFKHIFSALTYLQYQYVIFCNDAKYGGSSFYLPFHGNRELDTIGVKNEGIIYRNFDLMRLDKMRDLDREKDELFKYPPASSKPRHPPHVEKECRTKEYFMSRSFNYLSYFRQFKILDCFLANVNNSSTLTAVGKGSSINRLEDTISKSVQIMYAPGIAPRTGTCKPTVLYFFLDLIQLLCDDNKSLLDEKNKDEIIRRLLNIQDKQYLLFEIDLNVLKKALDRTPELLDEIFRIYEIEKKEKL